MPLVRVDIPSGKPPGYRSAFGEAVQQAMHLALGVPLEECFQVIAEHDADGLRIHPAYLGIARSEGAVLVQVTLNVGRSAQAKAGFYATLADALEERVGLRREDLTISLVEVRREDWSFGNGEAQLA